jgi:hypothetical protein
MKNINKVTDRIKEKEIDKINVSKKDASELQKKSTIINMKIRKLKQLLKKEKHEG